MSNPKYQHIVPPENGEAIVVDKNGSLKVPNFPIITFIEGDGIGIDVTPVMQLVADAAVKQAYQGKRKIAWMEIYAGEKQLAYTVKVI